MATMVAQPITTTTIIPSRIADHTLGSLMNELNDSQYESLHEYLTKTENYDLSLVDTEGFYMALMTWNNMMSRRNREYPGIGQAPKLDEVVKSVCSYNEYVQRECWSLQDGVYKWRAIHDDLAELATLHG